MELAGVWAWAMGNGHGDGKGSEKGRFGAKWARDFSGIAGFFCSIFFFLALLAGTNLTWALFLPGSYNRRGGVANFLLQN